ncbi:hypothetical protein FOA43_001442 [Brettanomyces nanus]|uniref:Uncharacterized protein n=1 Tax=Eeniella nana TaxID=13502 RepID=A0A875RNS7_EENNA|nr:uncharacterized protein FOA43_001442 [Brettanomyces nanus]QPG74120.1 hypothetical protein FOA43_001442 [Brettanomyces nanus]
MLSAQSHTKVIDFGTIDTSSAKADKHKDMDYEKDAISNYGNGRSFFSMWPLKMLFGTREQSGSRASDQSCGNIVDSPLDEVIAMKRLQGDASADNGTDDFIDIQVRKLSYAEVASLRASNKECRCRVVDQDKELEKSVTDMELTNAFKRQKRFDPEATRKQIDDQVIIDDDDHDDDGFDYLSQKKLPKRFKRRHSSKEKR